MRQRIVPLGLAGLALMLVLSNPVFAASHKGKVVEAGAGKLTMTDTAGKNQHTMEVPADATITCGGKKCGLEDLKPGMSVTVTTEKTGDQSVVTKVRAGKAGKMAKKAGSAM
jgi:hypothetical protein